MMRHHRIRYYAPADYTNGSQLDTLVKQIKDINKPLIVTTIQKMANAIKNDKYEFYFSIILPN